MEGNWINNPYNFNYQPLRRYEIIRVRGEEGAKSFKMAPNSSTILADETGALIWVVQTDGAGYLTATPYDITLHQQPKQIDINDLADRITQLEEMLNAKSNSGTNRQSKKRQQSVADGSTDTTN